MFVFCRINLTLLLLLCSNSSSFVRIGLDWVLPFVRSFDISVVHTVFNDDSTCRRFLQRRDTLIKKVDKKSVKFFFRLFLCIYLRFFAVVIYLLKPLIIFLAMPLALFSRCYYDTVVKTEA